VKASRVEQAGSVVGHYADALNRPVLRRELDVNELLLPTPRDLRVLANGSVFMVQPVRGRHPGGERLDEVQRRFTGRRMVHGNPSSCTPVTAGSFRDEFISMSELPVLVSESVRRIRTIYGVNTAEAVAKRRHGGLALGS
jgi:hypothetical protein